MKTASAASTLKKVAEVFARPIHELDGALVLGDLDEARRHFHAFPGDLTALEAFVNHVHLEDVVVGLALNDRSKRRQIMALGEALVHVWAERLSPHLQARSALFYLGGPGDVTLRFHVERSEAPPWFPLHDGVAVRRQRLRIYRAVANRLERIT